MIHYDLNMDRWLISIKGRRFCIDCKKYRSDFKMKCVLLTKNGRDFSVKRHGGRAKVVGTLLLGRLIFF